MKKCSKCEHIKDLSEFNKSNANHKDGLYPHCRACQSAYYKAYNARRKEAKPDSMPMFKVCRDCGLERPINQFGKKSTSLDKHNIYCKPCWRKRSLAAIRRMRQNGRKTQETR